jgi:MtN3 and saliva related transmembrane protein
MSDFTQMIGIGAAILTAISMLPQLIKIVKEKKAESVSLLMIIILMSGLALWVWYGIKKDDYPIIATNIFSLAVNSLLIFFGLKFKKNSK